MLSGEAVVAIWNDITDDARAEFYAWHLHEHMPERAGIPGFIQGRRYIATSPATQPEFFTLYETMTMGVLQGGDYLNRLNAPTPWTRATTAGFRNTFRSMATVLGSRGPGQGGILLTLRFDADPASRKSLTAAILEAAEAPRVTGAHLCAADAAASVARTAETSERSDIQPPPAWFAMIEATDEAALSLLLNDPTMHSAGARGLILRGCYRLEYTRAKTACGA
jgi:hypothetical protein